MEADYGVNHYVNASKDDQKRFNAQCVTMKLVLIFGKVLHQHFLDTNSMLNTRDCTGHFVMVPLNMTYLHCLQRSLFEHLFNLYCHLWLQRSTLFKWLILNYIESITVKYALNFTIKPYLSIW